MKNCPCGLEASYEACCGLYIDQGQLPQMPETLMRSRYTAYSLANTQYIKNTMRGKPLIAFKEEEAARWAKQAAWISLRIVAAPAPVCERGQVEYIATYLERGRLSILHERSEFIYAEGAWYYIDGVILARPQAVAEKIARNATCPCGGGKKFKNCDGKN